MRHWLALAACLLPALAGAQVTITESSLGSGARNDGMINIAECGGVADTITLAWVPASLPTATVTQKVWAASSDSECSNQSSTTRYEVCSLGNATGTTCTAALSSITAGIGSGFTCTHGATITFCVFGVDASGTVITSGSLRGNMAVDAETPAAPDPATIVVSPGDTRLEVSWQAPDSISTFYVAKAGARSSGEVTSTAAEITGLSNGTVYPVTVQSFSKAGNPSTIAAAADCSSTPAAQAACTPTPVDDFWTIYRRSGREQGGCGQGGAAALSLLGLLPLLLAPRLRRRLP